MIAYQEDHTKRVVGREDNMAVAEREDAECELKKAKTKAQTLRLPPAAFSALALQ